MAELQVPDVHVGNGSLLKAGIVSKLVTGLTALATFIATLSGNLPAGLNERWGIILTIGLSVVTSLIHGLNLYGKVNFAKAKLDVAARLHEAELNAKAGKDVLPAAGHLFEDLVDDSGFKNDTDNPPPVEPPVTA